jgi:hypothetical protein
MNLAKPDQHSRPMLLLKRHDSTCETVAHPGYCLDELWVIWVVVQFLVEPMHMHVYRARVLGFLAAPYLLLLQLVTCQNIAAMAHQVDEQMKEEATAKVYLLVPSYYTAPT